MTARQIENILTNEALASWHRVRSTTELLSLISRREAALSLAGDAELDV